jgi:hypothetical protein
MPVHKMRFVVVNNMAPRNPSVKAGAPRSDADMHGDAPRYGSPQRPPSSAPIKTPA